MFVPILHEKKKTQEMIEAVMISELSQGLDITILKIKLLLQKAKTIQYSRCCICVHQKLIYMFHCYTFPQN